MPLTSSLTKPLAPSWANRFKEQSLERGRRYALENRVRIVECGDSTITASCEGSGVMFTARPSHCANQPRAC